MKLHELPKQVKRSKRVGRGPASGTGKTAGRGTKGQKSRAGHHTMPVHFEGGQMPLTQRIPKLRGFRNPVAYRWAAVTLKQLAENPAITVATMPTLKAAGLVPRSARYLKIIGAGPFERKLTVTADRISAGALKAIESGGGTVTLNQPPATEKPPKTYKSATKSTPIEPDDVPTEEPDAG